VTFSEYKMEELFFSSRRFFHLEVEKKNLPTFLGLVSFYSICDFLLEDPFFYAISGYINWVTKNVIKNAQ
jgi:hypothetical protein